MVKVIKLGTWKKSNFNSAFSAQFVFLYLRQNRITHYQSSAFRPCLSFLNSDKWCNLEQLIKKFKILFTVKNFFIIIKFLAF